MENSNENSNEKSNENSNENINEKDNDYYFNIISNNITRKLTNMVTDNMRKVIGYYYVFIHNIIAYVSIIILLFSNNLTYLTIMLNFLTLDAMSIIALHNCPLTLLESKYLGYSTISSKRFFLNKLNIIHECSHDYETQFEVLTNVVTVTFCKILYIICMRTFKIQINHN